MQTKIKISTIYNCSLERAFKTPMLCDVSKVHTGYGIMPKVTHCTDDEHWGKPRYSKKVFVAKSLTQKGGWASVDKVIERIENTYWKIEVSDFKSWMLGFTQFEGEWQTTELETNKILVEYTYTLHSNVALLYPLNWLFTHTFWKAYMKRVLENIRQLANTNEPYKYD
ncbi:MAG: SRPBCC family protein [Bacteroidia bacterium]